MYLRGIGQEEAAQVAGCSRSLINLALADSDRVDDKTVEEIGWRLGVSGFRLNRFPKQKLGGSLDG